MSKIATALVAAFTALVTLVLTMIGQTDRDVLPHSVEPLSLPILFTLDPRADPAIK